MEGLTAEAASLAGHLRLGRLIVMYDDNEISIEGSTDLSFTEDVNARFEAYGWHVQDISGHDHDAIAAAIENAKSETGKPSIIVCHTQIGKGSPNKEGSASAHGEPLGTDEVLETKKALGWPEDQTFVVPNAVREYWESVQKKWADEKASWNELMEEYRKKNSRKAKELDRILAGDLPKSFRKAVAEFETGKSVASRSSGGEVLNMLNEVLPELIGGSADLAPSTKTVIRNEDFIGPGHFEGKNIHFGVREHAMGGVANGLALHGGFLPFCATFMVFADYMRPTMRLAAIMKQRVIFYFTHDSIFVGEDGPTHQPVEHLASMRIIPNLRVMRPCDANEVAEALCLAAERKEGPTVLALTRQNLPTLDRSTGEIAEIKNARKGAYILKEAPAGKPDMILVASGSEVHTALEAYDKLVAMGKQPRVVSMLCMKLFEEQSDGYKRKVFPKRVKKRVAVEASLDPHWQKYVGDKGLVIGMDDFGISAPKEKLAEEFGFTSDGVIAKIKEAGMLD
jgi:transketolase